MTSMVTLSDSVVLITGGTRGIGRALALRYAQAGARVFVTGTKAVSLSLEHTRHPITVILSDLSSSADRESLFISAKERFADLNILINNAGINRGVALPNDVDVPWTERQNEIDTDFSGHVHLTSLLVPLMLAHGRAGYILNNTSGSAFAPAPVAPMYSACKAALRSYTISLRYALENTNLKVIEVFAGVVKTGLKGSESGSDLDQFIDTVWPKIMAGQIEIGDDVTESMEVISILRASQANMFAQIQSMFPDVMRWG